MKKTIYHIIFWIFIWLYVFDYLIDYYSIIESSLYSLFELVVYISEFYLNLLVLIPLLFHRKFKILYFLSVFVALALFCSSYFIFNLDYDLLATTTLRAVTSFLLNHILFFIISYFVWHYNKYITEKEVRFKAEKQKLETEMQLLKSQISPHFLFNSLNNIYSLSLIKSDDAPKMISALSNILRYFIYEGNSKKVYIENEIDAIKEYIQLQKTRQIAGKNNINFLIKKSLSTIEIPPLILISLVENAFKHGNIINNENGFVNIYIDYRYKKVLFTISNSYINKNAKTGIGLKNIKSQLDLIFKSNYDLNINNNNNIFTVRLAF